jgi:uncharacterized iron-regulated membrane protein
MITCFTGAMLVFEKEFQHVIYPARYFVDEQEGRVSIATLSASLYQAVPNAKITSVRIFSNPARTAEITFTEEQKSAAGKGPVNLQAFMNPYTGEFIAWHNSRNTFFFTMFSLHRWLLAGDTGKLIVGVSTSIFLFIILTGLILWWPENMRKIRQRLRLKISAGWKRINHDLHIVIGFYTAIFLFVFAFTGLAWSFKWFNDGIYLITGTENKRPDVPISVFDENARAVSFDDIFSSVKKEISGYDYFTISAPKDSVAVYTVTALSLKPAHEKATDQYFFDQYSGDLSGTYLYKDRNAGQRARSTFYAVHVGSIAGLPGRVIAFLSCLAGATFPITGVILWINRLRKQKRKQVRKQKRRETQDVTKEAQLHGH